MNPADPARPHRHWTRWVLAVLVLITAGMIALWPRDHHKAGNATTPDLSSTAKQDNAALAAARRLAALQPCPTAAPTRAVSGPLAGVSVPCLGAPGVVDLGAALAGRPVLVNLWASWCVPCRQEIPVLAAYAKQPGAVTVLGVDVQDQPTAALGLLADLNAHYPSVMDSDRVIQTALAVPPVLPVSYLLLPDGSPHRITDPLVFNSADQIRAAVANELSAR